MCFDSPSLFENVRTILPNRCYSSIENCWNLLVFSAASSARFAVIPSVPLLKMLENPSKMQHFKTHQGNAAHRLCAPLPLITSSLRYVAFLLCFHTVFKHSNRESYENPTIIQSFQKTKSIRGSQHAIPKWSCCISHVFSHSHGSRGSGSSKVRVARDNASWNHATIIKNGLHSWETI